MLREGLALEAAEQPMNVCATVEERPFRAALAVGNGMGSIPSAHFFSAKRIRPQFLSRAENELLKHMGL
jgi:hypothetical protein